METESKDRRELVRQALRTIDELQARLAAAEAARLAPVAIVGIGCRYPGGVTGPESFWELLAAGRDAVEEVPAERWEIAKWYDADKGTPGKMSTRWGGFLSGIDRFDAQFFGISPREAAMLDPQHRVLLEVAWEALEHAGQPFAELAGSATGVFVGMTNNEYYQHCLRALDATALSPYLATGNVPNAAAGRLAFFLGTHGPSVVVDTACSSSLTAVHLACQSLRAGDCKMALAGGVNLIVIPETAVMFSKWGMMAADGRCKAFDAAADGFVRGEGCGVVVLKRLSDALEAGDRVLAVIEGSAVNQDGHSSGLTVPNGIAQQALIRQALASAGVEPGQIDYIEAHGTGTALGDPIEVEALAAVFGPERAGEKLRIGSVKTNLGHTESASGVAGLIKCVLALGHGVIPRQLHLHEPTPAIAWERMPIEVAGEMIPWARGQRPRRAGVSSFGFSGANAHVIVAEAPESAPLPDALARPRHILALSASEPDALAELATRYVSALRESPAQLADICFTANTGRARFRHRAAVSGASKEELAEALSRVAQPDEPWTGEPVKVAFLFTGQGSQYAGMGRQLYDSQPVFRAELDRCAALLEPHMDRSLLELIFTPREAGAELDRTCYTQPALFALEWALAQMWRAWGVAPAALLGHSVGEYAAACQCGVMSLEDGLALIAARARLMQSLPAGGTMAAVAADEATVREALAPYAATAAIAAVNGPRNVVISGRADAVGHILETLRARRISGVPLAVSHAFHSPLLDPILDEFQRIAGRVEYRHPDAPLVSNLTGAFAREDETASAAYWRGHARSAVRFADGVQELHRKGCGVFLEIGPSPVLINMARQCPGAAGPAWLPTLTKDQRDAWKPVLQSLGEMFVRGVPVDWAGFDRGYSRQRVALPTYPFQRKRFWIDKVPSPAGTVAAADGSAQSGLVRLAPGSPLVKERIYTGELATNLQPWLGDHVVAGQVFVPLMAYVEMALEAGADALGSSQMAIEDLMVLAPLILSGDAAQAVQLVLSPAAAGDGWEFRIISVGSGEPGGFTLHASGALRAVADGSPDAAMTEPEGAKQLDADAHYRTYASHGIDFGPAFRGVVTVTCGEGRATGEIRQPEAASGAFVFHPAMLDACLQPLIHAWPQAAGGFLPFAIERIEMLGTAAAAMRSDCTGRIAAGEQGGTLTGDATLCDADGQVVAKIRGLTVRQLDAGVGDSLYEVEWSSVPATHTHAAMPAPEAAVELAQRNHPAYLEEAQAQGFARGARLLEARSVQYAAAALKALGWDPLPGETIGLRALAERLRVVGRHERLLGRLMSILAGAGYWEAADVAGGGWTAKQPPAVEESTEGDEAFAAEFALLDHCGSRLAEVLRGECDPLDLLFGPWMSGTLEAIYAESLTTTAINRIAADVAGGIATHLPPEAPKLRVLEIGAGTGGTTRHALKQLPADRTEYLFTDISPALVTRARERFGDYLFMEYDMLDIERDLEAQGFGGREFDVILASNVVHATADLRAVLARIRSLLAPGGLLVLVEGTRPQSWIDLTFGMTDGWWKFTDHSLRPDYPLLDAPAWAQLLEAEGFSAPMSLAGPAGAGLEADYTVFVASNGNVSEKRGAWLVFADTGGTGDAAAEELRRKGHACVMVRPAEIYGPIQGSLGGGEFGLNPARRSDYDLLLEEVERSGQRLCGVAHFWSLNTTGADAFSSQEMMESQDCSCRSFLCLAQALAASGRPLSHGLWALTRGSQPVAHDVERLALAQAPVWGLAKVLALEHPELRPSRLDLDPAAHPDAGEAERIAGILLRAPEEAQWAIRAGVTYAPRLARKRRPAGPVGLVATEKGRLDSMEWQPSSRRAPGPGEVEIRVEAAAVNFRDVLGVLGMRPDDTGPLGGEAAGRVVAVGAGVDLAIGDAVAGLAIGGFNNYAVTHADLTVRKPADWSFAEIVTVPGAFASAYYGLVHLGRMRRGQRILIHTATGGVGLAAIQLARQAGCEILATAGSTQKRDYLRSLGIEHVFDSRSLSFADGIRELLGEEGWVDLILNTLSGDFIGASLSLLAPRGCFVELGKRDIWSPERVAAMRPEAAYHIVDLAALCQEAPAEFRPIYAAATAAIAAGTLCPLPVDVFPREGAQAAFRHMAQAKHIGKIVVGFGTDTGEAPGEFRANPSGSYLITGGLAGLGLRTAEWLAARGARHLALMARSEPDAVSGEALEAMRRAGVEVLVYRGDVAKPQDVDRVLAGIRTQLPPLRGVIHSAGVLDDGAILQQEWPRFEAVFLPKVAGGWNLHRATLEMPLDFFVLYSSASAILGSRGQGNHAAANAFLDALAHHRRALGLPALSINWGAWSEIGAAARRDVFGRVADYGVKPIAPDQGIAALERLLVEGSAQGAVIPMDWTRFFSQERPASERSFFAKIGAAPARSVPRAGSGGGGTVSLESRLAGAQPAERRKLIQATVREAVIGVLGLEPDFPLNPLQGFRDLGFDSLMSVELRNRLQTCMGRPLPATLAFNFPSLGALVDYFCEAGGDSSGKGEEPESEPEEDIFGLGQLSDAESEAMLAEELAKARELL